MSGMMRLTDDAIRTALTPAADVLPPAGLADAIRDSVDLTPQRQAGVLGWSPSPRAGLVLQLAGVALLLLGLLLGALLVGSRPTQPSSVLTYHGGPERTGIMPGPGPQGAPTVAWRQEALGPFGPWSPAVVGGTVYVGDQAGFVTALDETTGTPRWQLDVGSAINCGITYADGLLIVGDDGGVLHALDAATGQEDWQYAATGAIHGSAAVVDGVAYFGTTDGQLYALDTRTRVLRSPPVHSPGSFSRAIAAADGIIYGGSSGATPADAGALRAYDAATAQLVWERPLDSGNTSTPTVAGGLVFIASGLDSSTGSHRVFAFDARTGAEAWASPFVAPSAKVLLLGAVADGHVYVAGTDGTLYVLDAATGALEGTTQIQSAVSPNAGIVGQTLYVTSDDRHVHAIDVASPALPELWSVAVGGTPGAPTVIGGAILVTTDSGTIVKLTDPDATGTASTLP
jgi:outer membrane protein assembly factor BamB